MSTRPAYSHGSSARRLAPKQPAIHVITGGAGSQEKTASQALMVFAKVLIVGILVFALIGVVRISLSSATVAAALEAKQLTSQIETARKEGSQLEVSQSSLSNPSRIKTEAAKIGMSSPTDTLFMDMSEDVVVLDDQGNLSLSGTVAALEESMQGHV